MNFSFRTASTPPKVQTRRCGSGAWFTRRCVAALIGFALLLCLPGVLSAETGAASEAALQIKVRSGLHDGFARIVFDWKPLPAFQVSGDGTQVEIKFAEPFQDDFKPLLYQ